MLELLVLVALVAAGFVLVRLSWPRSTGAPVSGPVCGACGYNTTGLASLTCPECGRDLRVAGIVTPLTPAHGMGFAGAAVVFSALWLFASVLLTNAAGRVLPALTRLVTLGQVTGLDRPYSGAFAGVDVVIQWRVWAGRSFDPSVEVHLRTRAAPESATQSVGGSLKVNPSTGSYSYLDMTPRTVAATTGFGGDVVLQWLAANGVDVSGPRVKAEANRIAAAVMRSGRPGGMSARAFGGWSRRSIGNDPHFAAVSSSEGATVSAVPGLGPGVVALCFAVWLIGLRYLWLMTRASRA